MILAVDVHYYNDTATAAGVLFDTWEDSVPEKVFTSKILEIKAYQSGSFYKRELPCILQLVSEHSIETSCIIIDGYVHLNDNKPGLGTYLFNALQGNISVIGVAKNSYSGVSNDLAIYRGKSKKPLFVTSEGINLINAKELVLSMHGQNRIPTLLKLADQLCRGNLVG